MMTRPRQGKGQGRAARGQARGKKARARGQGKYRPGIVESWEDFNEAAMAEYLEAVTEAFAEELSDMEEAFRGEN